MELDCHTMLYNIPNEDEQNRHEDDLKYNENKFWEDIIYKRKLRIIGEYFCRKNKNKGKLIINNKKTYLKEFINIININKEQIKIKMVLNKNLYDKSYMFKDCKSLLELSINNNLEYIEDNEIFDMNNYNYELKNNEKYINRWEDEGTNLDISLELYGYFGIDEDNKTSINNISEIKKYTEKIDKDSLLTYLKLLKLENNYVNLKCIFYNCRSLSSLPDLSKWNIDNVIDMNGMFTGCSSLSFLPEISKWNIIMLKI